MAEIAAEDRRLRVAMAEARNMSDAAEQELGYVKSILHAIGVLARQDSELNLPEIIRLTECAHWIADNLESNVDYFCERINGEVH
jgi:hypothetical protein